jgi:hypothetical protein
MERVNVPSPLSTLVTVRLSASSVAEWEGAELSESQRPGPYVLVPSGKNPSSPCVTQVSLSLLNPFGAVL